MSSKAEIKFCHELKEGIESKQKFKLCRRKLVFMLEDENRDFEMTAYLEAWLVTTQSIKCEMLGLVNQEELIILQRKLDRLENLFKAILMNDFYGLNYCVEFIAKNTNLMEWFNIHECLHNVMLSLVRKQAVQVNALKDECKDVLSNNKTSVADLNSTVIELAKKFVALSVVLEHNTSVVGLLFKEKNLAYIRLMSNLEEVKSELLTAKAEMEKVKTDNKAELEKVKTDLAALFEKRLNDISRNFERQLGDNKKENEIKMNVLQDAYDQIKLVRFGCACYDYAVKYHAAPINPDIVSIRNNVVHYFLHTDTHNQVKYKVDLLRRNLMALNPAELALLGYICNMDVTKIIKHINTLSITANDSDQFTPAQKKQIAKCFMLR